MLDANEVAVQHVARTMSGYDVKCAEGFITRDNINDLIEQSDMASEIDVFSLDIDGNDYWVSEAMTAWSPRVVILEYNWHNWRCGPDAGGAARAEDVRE